MTRARSTHAVVFALLFASVARADEAPAPTSVAISPTEQEARRHFDIGRERFEAHDFGKAADAFQKSYDLTHRKELLYNIGVCRRELGQTELALDAFRQYLAFSGPNGPNADAVRQQVSALEVLVPAHLEVLSRGKAGAVTVDGTAAGRTPLNLSLPSGTHTVVAEGPWPTERHELALKAGERKLLEVGTKSRTGLWVGIGVGAAVVLGVVVTVAVIETRPGDVHNGTLQPGSAYFK